MLPRPHAEPGSPIHASNHGKIRRRDTESVSASNFFRKLLGAYGKSQYDAIVGDPTIGVLAISGGDRAA